MELNEIKKAMESEQIKRMYEDETPSDLRCKLAIAENTIEKLQNSWREEQLRTMQQRMLISSMKSEFQRLIKILEDFENNTS